MNCKMSIPNAFAETILRLRRLKNGSALLFLMQLLQFFFTYLWELWVDPLPTFIAGLSSQFYVVFGFLHSSLYRIQFLVDLCYISCIHSYSLQSYICYTFLLR